MKQTFRRPMQTYSQVSIDINAATSPRPMSLPRITTRRAILAIVAFVFMIFIVSPDAGPKQDLQSNPKDSSSETSASPSDLETGLCMGVAGLKYGLMIDAGSSGSRIHTYKFSTCTLASTLSPPMLVSEEFHQISPGLSSATFTSPKLAAASLKQLLDIALAEIPLRFHKCTPVAVKATAGLRMLGEGPSKEILREIRLLLTSYPFTFDPATSVEIMDGREEGVYAWITVNYLLKKLGVKGQTNGIMDLGGGSTQIAFEPTFIPTDLTNGKGRDPTSMYSFGYAGVDHGVYQHSYLGYGLNSARSTIKAAMQKANASHGAVCVETSSIPSMKDKSSLACQAFIKTLMFDTTSDACSFESCSFRGVFQPILSSTFAYPHTFHIFSYFYERIFDIANNSITTLPEIRAITSRVCNGDYEKMSEALVKEIKGDGDWCVDLSYIVVLLEAYGVGDDMRISLVKKVEGVEVGWCLGAAIEMVEKDSAGKC